MSKIINKTYLVQSKKIIDEYNNTINMIISIEEMMNKFIGKLAILKKDFEKLSVIPDDEIDGTNFENKLLEYTTVIDNFQKQLNPHVLTIEKLKKDSTDLYTILKDKYSHLSEEELKKEIQIGINNLN